MKDTSLFPPFCPFGHVISIHGICYKCWQFAFRRLIDVRKKLVVWKYHGFYLEMMKNLGKEVLTFWEKGERELARWVAVGDGRGPAILGQNPAPHRLFGALATSELWAPSPACSASTLLHTMYYIALCSIRAKSTKVHPSMCKICHSLRGTFLAPFCFLFLHGYTFCTNI